MLMLYGKLYKMFFFSNASKKKNPLPVPMRFLYDIVLLALNNHYFLNNISIGIRPFDFDIKCFLKSYWYMHLLYSQNRTLFEI